MRYALGVDGGNTKTDYLLCNERGEVAAYHRAGTCSRENLGYDGAYLEMQRRITALLQAADVSFSQVSGSACGLAGVDNQEHRTRMTEILERIGLKNVLVANDSYLGVKAGCAGGAGVCSINGTETSTGGVDRHGKMLQVGGLRAYSGDDAGGTRLAEMTLNVCYDAIYRFGEQSALVTPMLTLFSCQKDDFHSAIGEKYLKSVSTLSVIQLLFEAADAGDEPAIAVVHHVADTLAKNAAGCALRLDLPTPTPIVLAGSVWAKGQYAPMIERFKETFEQCAKRPCALHLLTEPPVAGAALWAFEQAGLPADRAQVLQNIQRCAPTTV